MLFAKLKDFKLRKNLLKFEYKIKAQKFVFTNLVAKVFCNHLKSSKISFMLLSLYQKSL